MLFHLLYDVCIDRSGSIVEASLAQLVEHPPCKRKVLGSIPRGGIYLFSEIKHFIFSGSFFLLLFTIINNSYIILFFLLCLQILMIIIELICIIIKGITPDMNCNGNIFCFRMMNSSYDCLFQPRLCSSFSVQFYLMIFIMCGVVLLQWEFQPMEKADGFRPVHLAIIF